MSTMPEQIWLVIQRGIGTPGTVVFAAGHEDGAKGYIDHNDLPSPEYFVQGPVTYVKYPTWGLM